MSPAIISMIVFVIDSSLIDSGIKWNKAPPNNPPIAKETRIMIVLSRDFLDVKKDGIFTPSFNKKPSTNFLSKN